MNWWFPLLVLLLHCSYTPISGRSLQQVYDLSGSAPAPAPAPTSEVFFDPVDLVASDNPPLYQLDCGGLQNKDGWTAINQTTTLPGIQATIFNAVDKSAESTPLAILPEDVPEYVLQSECFNKGNGTELAFSFEVTPGKSYLVSLYFNEQTHTTAGLRILALSVNGEDIDRAHDPFQMAGGQGLSVRRHSLVVTEATLDVLITSIRGDPMINAITVEEIDLIENTVEQKGVQLWKGFLDFQTLKQEDNSLCVDFDIINTHATIPAVDFIVVLEYADEASIPFVALDVVFEVAPIISGRYLYFKFSPVDIDYLVIDPAQFRSVGGFCTQYDAAAATDAKYGLVDYYVAFGDDAIPESIYIGEDFPVSETAVNKTGDGLLGTEPGLPLDNSSNVEATVFSLDYLSTSAAERSTIGAWGPIIEMNHIAVSMVQLPDGKVLTWAAHLADAFQGSKDGSGTISGIIDPATGEQFQSNNEVEHDMFCSGISMLENGGVFTSGGGDDVKKTSMFLDGQWQVLEEMSLGRWYGTNAFLPDGRVIAALGVDGMATQRIENADLDVDGIPEIHTRGVGWSNMTGADMVDILQKYLKRSESGEIKSGVGKDTQFYPWLHHMPNGKLLNSGPSKEMYWLDYEAETFTEIGQRFPDEGRHRFWGSSIMVSPNEIFVTGGRDQSKKKKLDTSDVATDEAILITVDGDTVSAEMMAPMIYERVFHNAVLTPSGDVIVIGGNTNGEQFDDSAPIFSAEMYQRSTDQWILLAEQQVPRTYHSTAVMLQDGRVMSGGGGLTKNNDNGVNHLDAEIFYPPYLFDATGAFAPRPEITDAPTQLELGETFTVTATGGAASFSMIRLYGTTHQMNTDMRYIAAPYLNATAAAADEFQLALSDDVNVMMPGYYWLYAINENGVPSVGHAVQLLMAGSVKDDVTVQKSIG